ncbi:hypothetical protein VTI74DRAFT_2773 [Chaetomium olivicolor]
MAHLSQHRFADEIELPEERLAEMDPDLDMLDHSEPPSVFPDIDMPDFSGRPSPEPAQPTTTLVPDDTERRHSQSSLTRLSRPFESLKLEEHAFAIRQEKELDVPEQRDKQPAEFGTKVASHETDQRTALSPSAVQALHALLDGERKCREAAEKELREKTAEAKEFRKRWKLAARELNELRSQSQGLYTVTDQYLIERTTHLRFNIRNFAILYFEGPPPQEMRLANGGVDKAGLFQVFISNIEEVDHYLYSEERCPTIIEAFLWRFLTKNVFGLFLWASTVAKPLAQLSAFLRPKSTNPNVTDGPDLERKFRIWNASTTALVIDSIDTSADSKDLQANEDMKMSLVGVIRDAIEPFSRSRAPGLSQELYDILDQAINLDEEMSKQVASVRWEFPVSEDLCGGSLLFDEKRMTAERGQTRPTQGTEVCLVVAPAMIKRGKSTGEDFDKENILVKMEVVFGVRIRQPSIY